MSLPQPVPDTEAQQIIALLNEVRAKQDEFGTAQNQMAALVNWLTENVKDIFAFFGSPQMMSMMGPMIGGMAPGMPPVPANLTGEQNSDPAASGTTGPAVPASGAAGDTTG